MKFVDFIYYTNLYEDTGLKSKKEISDFLSKNKIPRNKKETLGFYLCLKFISEY
jgi:hypothetical protein